MAKSRRKQQPQRSAQGAPTARARTASAPAAARTASEGPPGEARAVRPAVPQPAADPRAAERIARQQERAAARRRMERQRQIRQALIGLAALLLVGGGLAWFISTNVFAETPGRSVPIVSQEHIADGQKGTGYNSVPPTSGQHYARTADNGVQAAQVPDELQVHNLEHGQIMIQYTCTDCPELVEQLKGFAARYPKWVLVGPYTNPPVGARIALTAWGRIDTFDEYDEGRIVRFIEAHKNRGPEKVIRD